MKKWCCWMNPVNGPCYDLQVGSHSGKGYCAFHLKLAESKAQGKR